MNRKDFLKTSALATGGLLTMTSFIQNGPKLSTMDFMQEIDAPDRVNICKTCGTRYGREIFDENRCPVCLDDRQYLKEYGQQWVSFNTLMQNHTIRINQLRENVFTLITHPSFAIGQRAHLITTKEGNILWDCIPLLDEASFSFIKSKGGLQAIAISHPHYYSLMTEWARAFDCPVYLHKDDRQWVMDDDEKVQYWSGDKLKLFGGLEIVHTGGHFPGSSVLHFNDDKGRGILFTGDSLYLSRDKKHLSAMYSYPNVIPLAPAELFNVFAQVSNLEFDALYGAFGWQNIHSGARMLFDNSLQRYNRLYSR